MNPKILPVIHYASDEQVMRNADQAFTAGCEGVLIIHMEGQDDLIGPIAAKVKAQWPERLVGANYLTLDPLPALERNLNLGLDMTWTDKQVTHSKTPDMSEMLALNTVLQKNPNHLMFVGVAFKHQRYEPYPGSAARRAVDFGMIPTTSGPATGYPPTTDHVQTLRRKIAPTAPLAIASGMYPENVAPFAPLLTHILVATGVSRSFHEFDPDKLVALRAACGHPVTN